MPPLRSTHHARGPPHARSVSKTVLRLKTSGGGGEYGEGVNQDMGGGDITPIGLFTTKPLAMAAMHVAFEAFKTSMTESQDPPFKPVSGSMREEDPWAMLALGGETDLSPVRSIRMGRGYEYAGYASSEYGTNTVRSMTSSPPSRSTACASTGRWTSPRKSRRRFRTKTS